VPADGSAKPHRLTFSKAGESDVAWSPDSKRIVFSTKREGDEANQIYVLDVVDGGEAIRLTNLSTGASSPRWSPDGKTMLFTSTVFPGASDDEANKKIATARKARKYNARVYDSFPIRYWDKWLDDTRPHLFVQAVDPRAKPKDLLAGTQLAASPGFAGASTNGGQELVAAWAPDGQSIVFAAARNKNAAAYASITTHLFQIPAGGGEPKQLTGGPGSYAKPAFRPDGKALCALYEEEGSKVYYLSRIASFAWPEPATPKILTQSSDRSADSFAFSPDSKTIFLLAEDAGLEKIYSLPATGGEVKQAFAQTEGTYGSLVIPARAASTVLFGTWESATKPAEAMRLEPGVKQPKFLTAVASAEAAKIDWEPLRHFWFTSKRGKKIHNMLALPPNFDKSKKYPLLVLMHGGPHSMWKDQITLRWNYHLLARPGYVVLLTDYTGSTGHGEKFAQEIQGDPLQGPGDEINEAADEAIRQFAFIDGTRQAAAGASYGGHLANWMEATTTRYKCLVSHAGLVNLESQWGTSDTIYHREVANGGPVWEQGPVWREQNPIRHMKDFKTPILVTVSENDFRVPINQSIENWSALQRMRVPSRLIVFPDENHWVMKAENSRFYYQEVQAWLDKYLKP
jgi:dipeptidyl aminopeptidase/acylaminoacyl peptidase